MKKVIVVISIFFMMACVTSGSILAVNADELDETKRELALERVARITAQLNLIKIKFINGQKQLKAAKAEFKAIDDKIKENKENNPNKSN